jgi:hypothetical protein
MADGQINMTPSNSECADSMDGDLSSVADAFRRLREDNRSLLGFRELAHKHLLQLRQDYCLMVSIYHRLRLDIERLDASRPPPIVAAPPDGCAPLWRQIVIGFAVEPR